MVRRRLITILTFVDGVLFRTKLFQPDYRYTLSFVDAWSVDEVILLDVTRTGRGANQARFLDVLEQFAGRCFVPLTAGGGVRSVEHVRVLMGKGADKVVVDTGTIERPALVDELARAYGTQCVVAAMDVRRHHDGSYEVFSDCGRIATGLDPVAWAKRLQDLGAGEILITSIERDGSLQGYDVDLSRRVCEAVTIPVLVSGGAGNWGHFVEGFEQCGAAGVCTTNIFHFTEASIRSAKRIIASKGISVRQTHAKAPSLGVGGHLVFEKPPGA